VDNRLSYFKGILVFIQFYLIIPTVFAQSVKLAWTPSNSSNISHYGIYRSTHPDSNFTLIDTVNHPDSIYVDEVLQEGRFFYAATAVDEFGNESGFSNVVDTTLSVITSIDITGASGIITEFRLNQNYPNPFNPSTTIPYSLPKSSHVDLTIYNINGQIVYKLVDEFQEAGRYSVTWNGIDRFGAKVSSGTYYYKIKALNTSMFRKMILLQ